MRRSDRYALAFAAVLLAVAVASCDGAPEEEATTTPVAAPETVLAAKTWLEPADAVAPGQWLASRAAGRDVPATDPDAVRLGRLLDRADRVFDESPRMIANRARQVEEMLADIGIVEDAETVVTGFLDIVSPGGAHGFGALCQHYVNLRGDGMGRAAALDRLRAASGAPR